MEQISQTLDSERYAGADSEAQIAEAQIAEACQADTQPPEGSGSDEPMQSVYLFEDYRILLLQRFHWMQSQDPSFSQRKLARVAGFANPGFFNEVIRGRRKLSPRAIERMARGLALDSNEAEFLRHLVASIDGKTPGAREGARKRMADRRERFYFQRLRESQLKYYQDFNYPLVRACIEACDFRGDYRKLGDFLRPPMPADSLKGYVRDLCDMGLVAQDREGRYYVTHAYLEPPEGMKDALQLLHQAWMTQTMQLFPTVPPEERHVSSALMTVSEATYKTVLQHIERARMEILRMVREDKGVDRVMLLSIQALPRGGGAKT